MCNNTTVKCITSGGHPENYDGGGGGGAKIEVNPKPKKIQILGQFGTPKVRTHIYIKIWYSKNAVFFLFKHRHSPKNDHSQ